MCRMKLDSVKLTSSQIYNVGTFPGRGKKILLRFINFYSWKGPKKLQFKPLILQLEKLRPGPLRNLL